MAPALSEQLPTIHIDSAKLGEGEMKYNASIIRHEGRTLMAYRLHPPERWQCRIHIAELDDAGNVLDDYALEIPEPTERHNPEDPRLFILRGQLWIGWTQAEYIEGTRRWNCVQKYGRIEGRKIAEHHTPDYGGNDGSRKEKNWTFFDYEGRCMACYSHSPQVVIELEGERMVNEWITPGAPWGWGFPSGGTSPIPHGDKLLTYFHSYERHKVYPRKYFMAALTFDAAPPFAIREISSEPLLEGTEAETIRPEGWNCLVVFPCGAVKRGDVFRVSVGVNDMSIALVDVTENKLVRLGQKSENKETMKIRLKSSIAIGGIGRYAGETVEVKTIFCRDLVARGRAVEIITLPPTPEPEKPAPVVATTPMPETQTKKPKAKKDAA